MPRWLPAYLIHGDDHGRIAERRSKLRALAEAETGTGGVEILEGPECTAEALTTAINSMTFAMGRRFVIADGVERLKDKDAELVAEAIATIDAETLTVAFFAREEGKTKAPQALVAAVEKAGGRVDVEEAVKPWDLPKWVEARARELELDLNQQAAKALIAHVGDRQQRLLRELEKLALEYGAGAAIGVEEVEASTANSSERKAWSLADALVAGDRAGAVRLLAELREQGERVPGLIYTLARRLRDALAASEALAAGAPAAQVKARQRGGRDAVARFMTSVSERDPESFRRALVAIADLEVESRSEASPSEDTLAVRAVLEATRG